MEFALRLDFLLKPLLDRVKVGLRFLESRGKSGLGKRLLLKSTLGVFELVSQLLLQLGQSTSLVLSILKLAQEVAIFGL